MSSGNFIPTLTSGPSPTTPGTGNPTYVTQLGEYQIIGNICFVWLVLSVSAKDPAMSGIVKISGLPVVARANGINSICAVSVTGVTLDSGYTFVTGSVLSGGSEINLVENGSGKAAMALPASTIGAGSVIFVLHTFYQI